MTSEHSERLGGLDDTLATIGTIVIYMQVAERIIATALTHALRDSSARTVDQLTAEIAANNKATLGALLKKLNQRVDLDDDFADVLEAYLAGRNSLIHDVGRIPGFDLNTAAGLQTANHFLANLLANAETVTKVFLALVQEWADEVGYGRGRDEGILAYLGDYKGIARSVFFAKPTKSP